MKIDLPALNSKVKPTIDYSRVYPKNGYWPPPIDWWDTQFIEVNTPRRVLMENLTKPVSNIFKKIPLEVDLSVIKKERIFRKFIPTSTNKKTISYSPIGLSVGLKHFIACNRPYWSSWELIRIELAINKYEGYYKFSNNQIAIHVLWSSNYELLGPYDALKRYISVEFFGIGNIYGYNRETEKFITRQTKSNKLSLIMFLGAPCSTFYGTPDTGYINGRFRTAETDLWAALHDQDKFPALDNFLGILGNKLLDKIEALEILIDPNNLDDLYLSFNSYGLTFSIQGYKKWPVGCGYSYGNGTTDMPNFGSPNECFEMRIFGTAQRINMVYNYATHNYEPVYVPMAIDILTYIAVAYYVEDL